MSKIAELVERRNASRKAVVKIEYSILTLLLGELETDAKRRNVEISDSSVVAGAKKLIKSIRETMESTDAIEKYVELQAQIHVLQRFLPKTLTKEELQAALEKSGAKNKGEFYKYLKINHADCYDNAEAGAIFEAYAA